MTPVTGKLSIILQNGMQNPLQLGADYHDLEQCIEEWAIWTKNLDRNTYDVLNVTFNKTKIYVLMREINAMGLEEVKVKLEEVKLEEVKVEAKHDD